MPFMIKGKQTNMWYTPTLTCNYWTSVSAIICKGCSGWVPPAILNVCLLSWHSIPT